MTSYVKVVDEDSDDPIELPLESDGTLLLSTLTAQFPGASGLKYRADSGTSRGLRVDDSGRVQPPNSEDGWHRHTFIAVFPKENTKRKMDDHVDASGAGATKLKRIERKKCSDLIVLGLPYKTTEDELREYFEQFGEVLVSQIKSDPKTNKSKGFGFIRFADYDSQLKVLSQRHNIEGRWCDVKIPNSKSDSSNPLSRKIFVGRVSEGMEAEDLKEYFNQFGEVTDVFIPKPFRGFGFVTFTDPAVAEALCGEDYVIKGCSVHVSPAVPKDGHGNSYGPPSGGHRHHHHHRHRSSPPSSGQVSPQSKISRQHVWTAFPHADGGQSNYSGGYAGSPWANVRPTNRSLTPVPPPMPPPAQNTSSATNQATMGTQMGGPGANAGQAGAAGGPLPGAWWPAAGGAAGANGPPGGQAAGGDMINNGSGGSRNPNWTQQSEDWR